jgi:hypothetical protein
MAFGWSPLGLRSVTSWKPDIADHHQQSLAAHYPQGQLDLSAGRDRSASLCQPFDWLNEEGEENE